MSRGIIDETEDWLPIRGLEPGFDENKPPRTEELVGKELSRHGRVVFPLAEPSRFINHAFLREKSNMWI